MHIHALDYTAVSVSGKVGSVKPVYQTRWLAVVTPTDRPQSVRNRCVIKLFCDFVLLLCSFDISTGVGAFVIKTESGLSLFALDKTKYI